MNPSYRVILVDDEPIILRSLKVAIPWEQLNMEVVGTAKNGNEALKMAAELKPHIIISDIRMPEIDGITLLKKIMSDQPSVIFVILSGYGEFEYAKESIRRGAFDYLLKPIDHEELYNVMLEAKKKLEIDHHTKSEKENLIKSVQALSTLFRERMLSEMIEGTDQPYNTLYWNDNWEMQHPYYMLVVNLDNYSTIIKQWKADEKRLWFFAISNILREYGTQYNCLSAFPFHNGEWVMIFENTKLDHVIQLGNEIVDLINKYTKLSSTVGISRECSGLEHLNTSYHSAQNALYQRFIHGKGGVYHDQNSQQQEMKVKYPAILEKKLIHSIRTLDHNAFLQHLDELGQELKSSSCSKGMVEKINLELIVVLYRQFESLNLLKDITLETILNQLNECITLDEIILLVKNTLNQWMKVAIQEENEDPKVNMKTALEYISSRYHHDLGIDEVAEYIGLSCSHFCVVFKQETGYTFLEYLTKYRIEKACSILQNADVRVYNVAPLVGYQDPKYFTQVFKKLMGKTPTEYRTDSSNATLI